VEAESLLGFRLLLAAYLFLFSAYSSTLKMEAACSSEMPV
jgi:hypothetical protein